MGADQEEFDGRTDMRMKSNPFAVVAQRIELRGCASFDVVHDDQLVGQLYGYDPDGDPITAQLVSGPTNGTLTLNPDGTFTYTPNTHYVGPDSFTYAWSDGMGSSDVGTISIDVGAYAEDELCALMIATDG